MRFKRIKTNSLTLFKSTIDLTVISLEHAIGSFDLHFRYTLSNSSPPWNSRHRTIPNQTNKQTNEKHELNFSARTPIPLPPSPPHHRLPPPPSSPALPTLLIPCRLNNFICLLIPIFPLLSPSLRFSQTLRCCRHHYLDGQFCTGASPYPSYQFNFLSRIYYLYLYICYFFMFSLSRIIIFANLLCIIRLDCCRILCLCLVLGSSICWTSSICSIHQKCQYVQRIFFFFCCCCFQN